MIRRPGSSLGRQTSATAEAPWRRRDRSSASGRPMQPAGELFLPPDVDQTRLWVPKIPSESFRPEFHQIDEFNFDSAFVNSDNSAFDSLGQTNLRKIRPSFRDGPFGLFRRINLIVPSRFLRLDLLSICIREHINRAGFKLPADTGDAVHRLRGLR